jgi:hypothetical protein
LRTFQNTAGQELTGRTTHATLDGVQNDGSPTLKVA